MADPTPAHPRRLGSVGLPALIAAAVLLSDQLAKWLVVRELGPARAAHRVRIVDPVVALQYVENSGGAFGVFRGQTVFLTVMALVVIGALVLFYRWVANPSPWLVVSLGLLLGGALGNLLDRVRLGYVVDFVAVGPWPTFNVADSAITIGVLLVAWATLSGSQPVARTRQHDAPLPVAVERPDVTAAGGPAGPASER